MSANPNRELAGHSLPCIDNHGEITGFIYHLPGNEPTLPSEPLTDARLEEIRRSVPESYTGPWQWQPTDDMDGWEVLYATDHPQAGLVATVPDYGENLAYFIATARTAIGELLGEVARLRAETGETR